MLAPETISVLRYTLTAERRLFNMTRSCPSGDGGWDTVAQGTENQAEADAAARLVAAISSGDRSAEQTMVEAYGRGLLFLLERRCGDRELALDLRQDTFRVAIEKLRQGPIDEPGRLPAFLRGIAIRLLSGHHRKLKRRATAPDTDAVGQAADETPGPAGNVTRAQTASIVRQLLDELATPRDREVLKRVYLLDEDRDTICADLGLDSAHFSRVLFRAKQRFRKLLEDAERRKGLRLVGG